MVLMADDPRIEVVADALAASLFMGCSCCAQFPTCPHGGSFGCEVSGCEPPDRMTALASEVVTALDATGGAS